jgi:sister chromatid cohesion protein DCC1
LIARFTIKGQTGEDAVLCTTDKTYSLRSVALSNSVLVVTPSWGGSSSINTTSGREPVVIRDELHEILELAPSVPKLHGLISLLRGKEYNESDEVEDNASNPDVRGFMMLSSGHTSDKVDLDQNCYSYRDAKTDVQASDMELDRGLKERRILVINGK